MFFPSKMLPYVAAVVAVAPTFLYIPFYIYIYIFSFYSKIFGNIGNKP